MRGLCSCRCGILSLLIVGDWLHFLLRLYAWWRRRGGLCFDGRPRGESISNATVTLDDDKIIGLAIYIDCTFPVYVYECHDPLGPCIAGEFQDYQLRNHTEETGVTCWMSADHDSWAKVCDHLEWKCMQNRPCTAFEYSKEICLSTLLRVGAYECYYVPGDVGAGIHRKHAFPLKWLSETLVVTGCCGVCVLISLLGASNKEDADDTGPLLGDVCNGNREELEGSSSAATLRIAAKTEVHSDST